MRVKFCEEFGISLTHDDNDFIQALRDIADLWTR